MELAIHNQKTGLKVDDNLFAVDFNEPLVHQVVTAYLAGARAGSKAQKTRAEVRGGGRKPWRQKGTGRARAGTIRSPLWRSGGIHFAAKPRDYSQKVNKKMYQAALRSILSELARQDRLIVVKTLKIDEPKTKLAADELQKLGAEGRVLILLREIDRNLELGVRNLPYVQIAAPATVDPATLIAAERVIVTPEAVEALEARLK